MIPSTVRQAVLLAGLLLPLAVHAAAPPSVEDFFRKPAVTGALMSPNGRLVAMRVLSPDNRRMLVIYDIAARKSTAIGKYNNADVSSVYWLSNQRLAFTISNVDSFSQIGKPGLYAIDVAGGDAKFLTSTVVLPPSFADADQGPSMFEGASTSGYKYKNPDSMLVLMVDGQRSKLASMDTHTGLTAPFFAPWGAFSWLLDADGELRVVVSRRDGKHVVFFKEAEEWQELAAFVPDGPGSFEPLLYSEGRLYVRAYNGKDAAAIYQFDVQKKTLSSEPFLVAPGEDLDGCFILGGRKVQGFSITNDGMETVWLDKDMKALQAEIDALLPGMINNLSYGKDSETPYVLVASGSDTQSATYLLYDRDSKKLRKLGASRPGLAEEGMSAVSMERVAARDGLRIPLHVTLPAAGGKRPLPTVVLMGDSPWYANGGLRWDAEVQFLASRGYVVLQPSPRGTGGFGRAYQAAGARQWGLAVQDDIADTVKWSVRQGYSDPARICIIGGGYGGYASMMGLIRDPELFKCGASWSGIVDIGEMFARSWEGGPEAKILPYVLEMVGDPKRDAAQFQQTSPLRNAARIKQPVLLAYGTGDVRVPYFEGRDLYKAISAGNSQVEWLTYTPGVDDGLTKKNRIDLWRKIEAFLAKHIGQQ